MTNAFIEGYIVLLDMLPKRATAATLSFTRVQRNVKMVKSDFISAEPNEINHITDT